MLTFRDSNPMNNRLPDISLPFGVSDFLPDAAAKIGYIEDRIRRVFELWGFRRVITPKLEYEDVMALGLGDGLKNKTYRFDDRQTGRLLAFPPDITPQIARIVATRLAASPLPHRISYSGRVLRQTESQTGRSREIFQSGVELIGLDSPEADAEMVAMAVEALQGLGFSDFKIDLGQVEFFRGIVESSGLSGQPLRDLLEAVARKDASAVARICAESPLSEESRREIASLPRLFGGREVVEAADRVACNSRSRAALDNLRQVLDILDIHGVSDYLTIDLGETRGLDYHTGITFEGFVTGLGVPVCGGGRYDSLAGRYGFETPATGFTFDVLSLLQALERRPELEASTARDFLLFNRGSDRRQALETARLLRSRGYSTARDIIRRDVQPSLEYARRMNIRCMLVMGDESDKGVVRAIRTRDGKTVRLASDMLCRDGLMEYIEENQGE
ncbi:histidyl-tRNA synthetase [Pelobacter propionicus DSM 2379]|uniref:ATP phosphoribosyltransferase regulatory subunit n=2 Tax=Pelobacter propionicus TaxID=29543 RepID=A1ALD0_PELPD|nr:histidyl-tRNA synthetase [Pelobacter propionicus DSM 2379]